MVQQLYSLAQKASIFPPENQSLSMAPAVSFFGLRSSLPFPGIIRQVEREMETVVQVLRPGPLGTIEHKFSAEEMREANATVKRAVENWRATADLEKRSEVLKDFIE